MDEGLLINPIKATATSIRHIFPHQAETQESSQSLTMGIHILKATRYYDWPPFSREYESEDCNMQR